MGTTHFCVSFERNFLISKQKSQVVGFLMLGKVMFGFGVFGGGGLFLSGRSRFLRTYLHLFKGLLNVNMKILEARDLNKGFSVCSIYYNPLTLSRAREGRFERVVLGLSRIRMS